MEADTVEDCQYAILAKGAGAVWGKEQRRKATVSVTEGFGRCLALSLLALLVFLANARGSERKQGVRYLKTGRGLSTSRRGSRLDPLGTPP